jgi:hypothetical protein
MLEGFGNFVEILNENSGTLLFLSNILLILVTGFYVFLTKKILDSSKRELDLSFSPVIGIQIDDITVGPTYNVGSRPNDNRRNMSINLTIVNIGNAPAIQVLVDSIVVLKYTDINGVKEIPARFEPSHIPYVIQGQEIGGDVVSQGFGNRCISQMHFDFLNQHLLNRERIQNEPSREPYNSSKIKIFVYYKNHLNQYFISTYETYIYPYSANNVPIPGFAPTQAPISTPPILPDDQIIQIRQNYIPRPIFIVKPIEENVITSEINVRNRYRNLCGW